jgi:hypothetical protein
MTLRATSAWPYLERDPTRGRGATKPGFLAPYAGKYEVPNTTPDALQCQQLLAVGPDGQCSPHDQAHFESSFIELDGTL